MKKSLPLLFLVVLIVASCYKESFRKLSKINGAKWEGTYAVPALNLDVGLNDAVNFIGKLAQVQKLPGNIIYFNYKTKVSSMKGDELVTMSNQNFNFANQLTPTEQSTLSGSGSYTANWSFSGNYINPYEIDSLIYYSGTFSISATNNYDDTAMVTITFPDLIKNGSPVSVAGNMKPRATQNFVVSLAGCKMNFTNGAPGFNHFRCDVKAAYTYSGSAFQGGDDFHMSLTSNSENFQRIWGYFGGTQVINTTDSVDIDIFSTSKSINTKDIYFDDPRVKVLIDNHTGIPFHVNTSNVVFTKSGQADQAVSNFPTDNTVSGLDKDSVFLTKGNSNVKTVINSMQPEHMQFSLTADANPNGPVVRNMIDKDARLDVIVSVDLPFNGWAGEVEASDTSPMKMDLGGFEDHIEWIEFRVETENDIPLEANFQGYFADSAGNLLDSIFFPYRVFAAAANVDVNGDVVSASHDVYKILYDQTRIKRILSTKQFILKVGLSSAKYNSTLTPVKITIDQRFKMQLGVQIKLFADDKL